MKKFTGYCRWVSVILKILVSVVKQRIQDDLFLKVTWARYLLVLMMGIPSISFGAMTDWCSSTWTQVGNEYQSTSPNGTIMQVKASAVAPAVWSFSPNGNMNAAGVFSDVSISGAFSLVLGAIWDSTSEDGRYELAQTDSGTGTLTFSFNHRVIDPVLHIDRIGGWGGNLNANPQVLSNSAVITANSQSSNVSFEKLGGVDHFIVTPTSINRLLDQPLDYYGVQSDSGSDGSVNTAMGSVKVGGRFSSLSLDFMGGGVEGAGFDGIEFVVCSLPYDLSDAPTTGTAPDGLSANAYGEAAHAINNNVYIGDSVPDYEFESISGITADGDDLFGDDEEGVSGLDTFTQDESSELTVKVTGAGGYLQGWIDSNGNGVFESAEQIATNLQDGGALDLDGVSNGVIRFSVAIPNSAVVGSTYARFRWSTQQDLDVSEAAIDGEVEDYLVNIATAGYLVSGFVFNDSMVNGIKEAIEAGIVGVELVLLNVDNNQCMSARTDASGNYQFTKVKPGRYQIYEAEGELLSVPRNCGAVYAKDPAGYVSTSANVLDEFLVIDVDISNKNFADMQWPTLSPDHSGTVLPSNVVEYSHTLLAKSTGSVNFTSVIKQQHTQGWQHNVYRDTNCNKELDGTELDLVLSGSIVVTAGESICLMSRVYAPANVQSGEVYSYHIEAVFDSANVLASTTKLQVTDITTVAANDVQGTSRLELKKTVENLSQGTVETETQNQAHPGDTLKYRIYYQNTGNAGLTDLEIMDIVPEFTSLKGTPICEGVLPTSLTRCEVSLQGDNILWDFPANDELKAGEGAVVSFEVIVD